MTYDPHVLEQLSPARRLVADLGTDGEIRIESQYLEGGISVTGIRGSLSDPEWVCDHNGGVTLSDLAFDTLIQLIRKRRAT